MSEGSEKSSPQTGVVTFLDVLGWKGVYNRLTDSLTRMASLVSDLETQRESFAAVIKTNLDIDSDRISIQNISDTIVLTSPRIADSLELTVEIHGALCRTAITESITLNIPVRGATSYGEYQIQGNSFVGKAIDEATAWHEACDWIGVHLTPSTVYALERQGRDLKAWVSHHPPIHSSSKNHHMTPCVNWYDAWCEKTDSDHEIAKKELLDRFLEMGPITPDIAAKFENTISFFDACGPEETANPGS